MVQNNFSLNRTINAFDFCDIFPNPFVEFKKH